MPAPLSERARRVTLNLFEADCQTMERRYGHGWTEQVRRMVKEDCKRYREYQATLKELENGQ